MLLIIVILLASKNANAADDVVKARLADCPQPYINNGSICVKEEFKLSAPYHWFTDQGPSGKPCEKGLTLLGKKCFAECLPGENKIETADSRMCVKPRKTLNTDNMSCRKDETQHGIYCYNPEQESKRIKYVERKIAKDKALREVLRLKAEEKERSIKRHKEKNHNEELRTNAKHNENIKHKRSHDKLNDKIENLKHELRHEKEKNNRRSDRDKLNNANSAYNEGRYYYAFKIYENLSNKGLPDAQFYLGKMFERGLATKRNSHLASYWYDKAAQGWGSRRLSYVVATKLALKMSKRYFYGINSRVNYRKAHYWAGESYKAMSKVNIYKFSNNFKKELAKIYRVSGQDI